MVSSENKHINILYVILCILSTRYYDTRYLTREQGQLLIIPHVKEADNGEYCCIASNGIGEPAKSCGALQLKMSKFDYFPRIKATVKTYFIILPTLLICYNVTV